jgi:hypothetical protein
MSGRLINFELIKTIKMNEIKSQSEYRSKKEQVISKFREEFVKENYNYDPMFHNIVELLIRDIDPYEIIERLISNRNELVKKTEEFMNYNAKPIIIPK